MTVGAHSDVQSQAAVFADFSSKQLLLFAFIRPHRAQVYKNQPGAPTNELSESTKDDQMW